MTLSEERRAEILAAVGSWLDGHADEPLPAGVDPSLADDAADAPNLADVVGTLVGLRHDVKVQTKAFKRVEEQLAAALAELAAERARQSADGADLIELYDRLRRCGTACGEAAGAVSWLSRRATVERLLGGIGEGIELVAERAQVMLMARGLRPFDPLGERFDAERMRAVGRVPCSAEVQSGFVAVTVRAGIERIDDRSVVRPAEVLVAREE